MNHEITLKIKCSMKEFYEILENKGFSPIEKFLLHDIYFIPKDLDIKNMRIRDILSKAVLLREIIEYEPYKEIYRLTYKNKDIAEDGTILNQEISSVIIDKLESGRSFIEAIGYKEIMEIKDYNIVYEKDGFQIATKNIENGDDLIEIEIVKNDKRYDTIEKIQEKIKSFYLPLYMDNFFVKKAEIELKKALER